MRRIGTKPFSNDVKMLVASFHIVHVRVNGLEDESGWYRCVCEGEGMKEPETRVNTADYVRMRWNGPRPVCPFHFTFGSTLFL